MQRWALHKVRSTDYKSHSKLSEACVCPRFGFMWFTSYAAFHDGAEVSLSLLCNQPHAPKQLLSDGKKKKTIS